MVRLPEGTEQIRLAPLRALRAVFSGVGQLLMAADRLREEDAEQARETDEEPKDSLASWNARLSSSVRLLPPDGTTDSDASEISDSPPEPRGKPAEVERTAAASTRERGRAASGGSGGSPARASTGSRKPPRAKATAEPSRFRSLDLTGNVRMLSEADIADMTVDELERSGAIRPDQADGGTDPSGEPAWSQAAPSWSSWSAPKQDESPEQESAESDGTGD